LLDEQVRTASGGEDEGGVDEPAEQRGGGDAPQGEIDPPNPMILMQVALPPWFLSGLRKTEGVWGVESIGSFASSCEVAWRGPQLPSSDLPWLNHGPRLSVAGAMASPSRSSSSPLWPTIHRLTC